jgi:hypothetical protein
VILRLAGLQPVAGLIRRRLVVAVPAGEGPGGQQDGGELTPGELDRLEPDEILADPMLRSLIDFSEPTAFLLLSNLHFVSDEADPAGLIAALLDPFPAGSHVAISHATPDTVPEVNDVERVFDEATEQAHVRSRAAVRMLIEGLEVVEPGLTWPPEWRPDPGDEMPAIAAESYYCVVVARKPGLPGATGH